MFAARLPLGRFQLEPFLLPLESKSSSWGMDLKKKIFLQDFLKRSRFIEKGGGFLKRTLETNSGKTLMLLSPKDRVRVVDPMVCQGSWLRTWYKHEFNVPGHQHFQEPWNTFRTIACYQTDYFPRRGSIIFLRAWKATGKNMTLLITCS